MEELKLEIPSCRNKKIYTWILIACINTVLCLITFFSFIGKHFSIDSYGIWVNGFSYYSYLGGYRYIGAAVLKILELIGRNPMVNDTPEIIIYCVAASVLVTVLTKILAEKLQTDDFLKTITIDLGILLTIVNVITGNQMSFPECVSINTVGLICCFGSVFIIHSKRSVFRCVLASVLLIMSIATFQFYLAIFAVFMLSICLIEMAQKQNFHEKITVKTCFEIIFRPALVFVLSLGIYYAIGVLIQNYFEIETQARAGLSLSVILNNIVYYILHQHAYIRWRQFFNTDYMTVLFAVAFLTWIAVTVRSLKKGEHLSRIVAGTTVFLMAYACMYILPIISSVRSIRAMGPLFGIYLLFLVSILVRKSASRKTVAIFTAVLSCALIVNTAGTIHHQRNLTKTNALDKTWADAVLQEIYEYEESSGIEVSKVAFCQDENPVYMYYDYSYTESAMSGEWSQCGILNVYKQDDHRNFTVVEMPEAIAEEHYSGKDWVGNSVEEQIVIIGDTAYICCW